MAKKDNFKEFIAEAEEHIELIHQTLTKIRKLPDRGKVKPDLVNAIFRAAHTLKGMSGMVGLIEISEISHTLEDLLDKIRMGKVIFDPGVLDLLLEGVDLLQEMVDTVGKGKKKVNAAPLQKKIKEYLASDRTSSPPAPPSEPPARPLPPESPSPEPTRAKVGTAVGASPDSFKALGLDDSVVGVLSEYETHRLHENIHSGARIYEAIGRFDLETFDKDLTKISERLNEVGEVISTLPSTDAANEQQIIFRLLVGVSPESGPLHTLISHPRLEIRELQSKPNPPEPAAPQRPSAKEPDTPEAAAAEPEATESTPAEESPGVKSQTLRVETERLDTLLNLVGELVLTKAMVHEISRELMDQQGFSEMAQDLSKASRNLDKRVTEIQEEIIQVRMIPIGHIFDRLTRAIWKLSKELGKEVELQISGEETKMDKSMVEEVSDPLMHLIRNALDHGIESKEERRASGKQEVGTIWLRASQKGSNVVIEIEDDGRGIDLERVYETAVQKRLIPPGKEMSPREIINLLFLPGFSTRESVTEISGRGVGLDVVAKNVTRLSGLVDVETVLGKRSKFSITLPITLIIIKALIIGIGAETFAIPLNSVSESLMVHPQDVRKVEGHEVIQLRDHTLPLLRLKQLFRLDGSELPEERIYVIVVGMAEKRVGFVVDSIEGQQEIVIKSVGALLKGIPGIAGATELGNRKTILVLDVASLIEAGTRRRAAAGSRRGGQSL